MKSPLTERQRAVLAFLRTFQANEGYMPTMNEIRAHFGWASQTAAADFLAVLEHKGFIRRIPNKARAIVLLG